MCKLVEVILHDYEIIFIQQICSVQLQLLLVQLNNSGNIFILFPLESRVLIFIKNQLMRNIDNLRVY